MTRNRFWNTFLGTVLVASTVAGSAFADDLTFDGDEFGDFSIVELEHLDELLADGKALYERRNFEEASLRFFDVLTDTEEGAEAYYPEAEYELAKTLFRLELYQGSLGYFGTIAMDEFHPFHDAALRGLLLLTEVVPGDVLLREYLSYYADYFPEAVPEQYRDQFAFIVGRFFYEGMEIEKAINLLGAVSAESPDYAQARYIMGITHVANYDAEPAVDAFRDVLRFLNSQETPTSELRGQQRLLLDLTHLAMARVYYSTGQFDTSISYYRRIPRDSPRWPEALFESSWGFFQVDQFNQALGNLHSLNSPFFADAYFPEGPILAAVIYFYNCNYELVRDTLYDYEFIYNGLRDDLQAVIDENFDAEEMFQWGQSWRRGEVRGELEFQSALRAGLNDRQLMLRYNLIQSIEQEQRVLDGLSDSWKSSLLGASLIQEANLARSFAISDAGTLTEQRLERILLEVDALINQNDRILFEVARAERGEIEADIAAGMRVAGEEAQEAQLQVSDEDLYWLFDGEYWKDELGFYYFDIRSECRR